MGIQHDGILAERLGRNFLKNKKFNCIQQIDWLVYDEEKDIWFAVEVKARELFQPPPFFGTGLDKKQLYLRTKLLNSLDIHTLLVVFEKNHNNIYYQWLNVLEKKNNFIDTKNDIRIYNIIDFIKEEHNYN